MSGSAYAFWSQLDQQWAPRKALLGPRYILSALSISLHLEGCCIKWDNACKAFSTVPGTSKCLQLLLITVLWINLMNLIVLWIVKIHFLLNGWNGLTELLTNRKNRRVLLYSEISRAATSPQALHNSYQSLITVIHGAEAKNKTKQNQNNVFFWMPGLAWELRTGSLNHYGNIFWPSLCFLFLFSLSSHLELARENRSGAIFSQVIKHAN